MQVIRIEKKKKNAMLLKLHVTVLVGNILMYYVSCIN